MSVTTTAVATNPWQAIAQGPVRYLRSRWPWRSLAYLGSGCVVGVLLLVAGTLVVQRGTLVSYVVAVACLLAVSVVVAMPLAVVERRRLRLVDTEPAGSPHVRLGRVGWRTWWRVRTREPATWRELSYMYIFTLLLSVLDFVVVTVALLCVVLPLLPIVTLGVGIDTGLVVGEELNQPRQVWVAAVIALLALPLTPYLVGGVAAGQATLARLLLAPREEELNARLRELARSQVRLVDLFEGERRRIERDLHDGAQRHLVSLAMTLGLAELHLRGVEGEGPQLVARARRDATQALAELRELVRGIHPQVLTARGIEAAVLEMVDRLPVPVEVDIDLPRRPEPAVEAVAYFVISEALTNVARHSGAGRATVHGRLTGETLTVVISDDGRGGAVAGRGTGIQGMIDRVAVVAGAVTVTSPAGGPTDIEVVIPCPARSG